MSNQHDHNLFKDVKNLDESISWDPKRQFELRKRIESEISNPKRERKLKHNLLPIAGMVAAMCIIIILFSSSTLLEESVELGNTSGEQFAEAELQVEDVLTENNKIYTVNLDVEKGSECNFWLNNLHNSYNYKYKVYAPDGTLIGKSETAKSQERLYAVDLSKYGSGVYTVKVYSPYGNIGGKYVLRVRNF
ncbi:hypothetical protein [Cytobacillus sp. IB215316]|uniref:hypothetical protein n=1 Tax=Cytobacillus sp. IB215316 TaxID=3097354 RepID=UPI002A0E1A3E|nr:hypothetical protein [Cytobacillus sp. IB215316]MDX8360787.1 hypothetical protein [Cytobacillus sp. IB215316]